MRFHAYTPCLRLRLVALAALTYINFAVAPGEHTIDTPPPPLRHPLPPPPHIVVFRLRLAAPLPSCTVNAFV